MFEKLDLKFDIQELREWFKKFVIEESITMRSQAVGGWSVQSSNGTVEDGWQSGFVPYNGPRNLNPIWQNQESIQAIPMQEFSRPTSICVGYMAEVLDELEKLQLNPRRSRIILLKSESEGQWHQDGSSLVYQVRLHIPIFSNESCFFETKAGKERMIDDGSCYLVQINQPHRVVNLGSTNRYHFVTNVWDQMGISANYKYSN